MQKLTIHNLESHKDISIKDLAFGEIGIVTLWNAECTNLAIQPNTLIQRLINNEKGQQYIIIGNAELIVIHHNSKIWDVLRCRRVPEINIDL